MGVPARAAGLALGYAADLTFADPQRAHPVAAWVVLSGRSLTREGSVMARLLDSDDLPAARDRLSPWWRSACH